MNFTFSKLVFGGLLSAVIVAVPLGATPVGAGTFNLAGTLYIAGTAPGPSEILFGLNSVPPPGDEMAQVVLPATGPFSGLTSHDTATIMNLTSAPSFPSGNLTVAQWIQLPDGINVDLANVPFNLTVPVCTGTAADDVDGFSCRPAPESPIILTQTSTGVTAKLNVMGTAYSGTSASGTSELTGILSAQFSSLTPDGTISGLLSDFVSTGHIVTGYEGNFATTTSPTVPEPGMLAGVGLGLLALGFSRRKMQQGKAK
jgi:PEP-CTERM motif